MESPHPIGETQGISEDTMRMRVPAATNPVIRIWPNPASDMIRIEGFERARVSIYTVSGVRVLVRENYTGGESIRVADLPGGLYIVRISSGRDSATAPLIKQ